jgi:NAD(P)-dependent dehydrogenase (short-subunit alcohol dehydrogenase family)
VTTVVVTGSASGIGAACAARLAAAGTTVIGIDRRDATVVADLGTVDGRADAVDAVAERSGGTVDGVVTCAGLAGAPSRPGSLLTSVNYFGTVAVLDGLRPMLARGTRRAAVAISSNSTTIQPGVPSALVAACLAGDEPAARALADEVGSMATYPATKLAVAHWVRTRATGPDWAGAGLRLNAVAPGMVDTPLIAEGLADPQIAPLLAMLPIPAGGPGRPEEIAAVVDLLLGPDGGFFCGSVVFVDGGSDALLRPTDWPAAWDLDPGSATQKLSPG